MNKHVCLLSLLCAALLPATADAALARTPVAPARIVWMSDTTGNNIKNPEILMNDFTGQVSVADNNCTVLRSDAKHQAAILLDFGKELHGAIRISSGMRASTRPLHVRVRLGESVTEAMSDVSPACNPRNATNEHAMRDFDLQVPWLGSIEYGNSGFRFARIDLLDQDVDYLLRSVQAISVMIDDAMVGSFKCSDERLNKIWETGAYTVQLNMQDYLWDGVKRDRLVWVGDLHPEVMTIANVFGNYDVVKKSLDFARDTSPLPGWMNGIAAYSMWWMIIHRDLCLYSGDTDYLAAQLDYMHRLVDCFAAGLDGNKENFQGGQRLLDWPTSEMPEVIHCGYQSLLVMAMDAGTQIGEWAGDTALSDKCTALAKKLRKHTPPTNGNKQAAALALLSDMAKNRKAERNAITEGNAHGFSTFYGYYMLEALGKEKASAEALSILSDYWGLMLDLGATTFWEDLVYEEGLKAARIDEIVPEGSFDIHASAGNYCYKGHRHSFCHGWASGPTPWLSRYILGIRPLKPGFEEVEVEPCLGTLEWAEGSVPTPKGPIHVKHRRLPDGKIDTELHLPDGVRLAAH